MNKKSFILAALAAASSMTSTKAAHGPYVGLGVGALIAHHDATINHSYSAPLAAVSQTRNPGITKYAPAANVLLGYGGTVNNFFWGAEVEYIFGNLKKSTTSQARLPALSSQTTKADSTGGAWGAALRLGYRLDRVTPYIRLGLERRSFKLVHSAVDNDIPAPPLTEISRSIQKTAFTPGIGIEVDCNKDLNKKGKFILGLEYRTAFYRSIKATGRNPGVYGRVVNYKVTPKVSTALVTLKYSWF